MRNEAKTGESRRRRTPQGPALAAWSSRFVTSGSTGHSRNENSRALPAEDVGARSSHEITSRNAPGTYQTRRCRPRRPGAVPAGPSSSPAPPCERRRPGKAKRNKPLLKTHAHVGSRGRTAHPSSRVELAPGGFSRAGSGPRPYPRPEHTLSGPGGYTSTRKKWPIPRSEESAASHPIP